MAHRQSINFVFVIQGEGRGHFTQAISLFEALRERGHTVSKCYIGISPQRRIPKFVLERLHTETETFESPNFLRDNKNQGILIWKSIRHHLFKMPKHIATSNRLVKSIRQEQPQLVVNFFEPLLGFSQLFNQLNIPIVCIAHQYLSLHKNFKFPKGRPVEKWALKLLTYISQIRSVLNLGLSFYAMEKVEQKKITVVPPLLRAEVINTKVKKGNRLLVYLLNEGYAAQIIDWHASSPEIEIDCFVENASHFHDSKDGNLRFYEIQDELFVQKMAACKALLTTAGFETVCEAMSMGKYVVMTPVKGHYEQYVNAHDALKVAKGEVWENFNAKGFNSLNLESNFNANQNWIKSGVVKIIDLIESLINREL